MGGGKGGSAGEPIYRPQTTNLLENLLTAQTVGTVLQQNPSLINVLQATAADQGFSSGSDILGGMGGTPYGGATPVGGTTTGTTGGTTSTVPISPYIGRTGGQQYVPPTPYTGGTTGGTTGTTGTSSPYGTQTTVSQYPFMLQAAGGDTGGTTTNPYQAFTAYPTRDVSRQTDIRDFGLDLPSSTISDLGRSAIVGGTSMTGQRLPQYTAPEAYQFDPGQYQQGFQFQQPGYQQFGFQTPDIQNVPQSAYQNVLNRGLEGIQQDQQRAGAQIQQQTSSRNLGQEGLAQAPQSALARAAMQQASNLRSNIGLQQAQSEVDVAKTLAPLDLQRQQLQAGEGRFMTDLDRWRQAAQSAENLQRGQLGLQAGQAQAGQNLQLGQLGLQAQTQTQDQLLRNIGALGTLEQQQMQQAMMPYQMLQQLYGQNIGIPMMPTGGGKGDPFSALLGAGATIGSAFCLPRGTEIEMIDGTTKTVEDVDIGEQVKGGGFVTDKMMRLRKPGHKFSKHIFKDGTEITMTLGHPYLDELDHAVEIDDSDGNVISDVTCDIQTTNEFYYVSGVKLGSTIGG